MCSGVSYNHNGNHMRVYFPNPKAKLPVIAKDNQTKLILWGRRKGQSGRLPLGGWARLDSIHSGVWDRWFPKPVKIPVLSFMEKDHEGKSHWFDLIQGQWIQGLIAAENQEQRLYVVTIEPELEFSVHDRWPIVMSG
ncbi:MAG: hypothetical protein P8L74_03470 [Gammaproteobacteria bacterium]|nr:hypothetical protein [Gammaproteobacteria bacterium]